MYHCQHDLILKRFVFFIKILYLCCKYINMIEIIKHSLGFCGEAHPNMVYFLGMPAVFIGFRRTIKICFGCVILGLKTFLKRLY